MMRVLRLVGVFLAARPLGSVSWRIAVSATGSKPLERWLSPGLLLWEALLGPLLSLSTVVVFSVTSTLDGEREGESGGWGRVSELGGASEWPRPLLSLLRCRLWVTQRARMIEG